MTSTLLLALSAALILGSAPTLKSADERPVVVATTPIARDDDWGIARQDECLRRVRTATSAKVVFLGDSITQGWEDAGAKVWKERLAPLDALQIGVGGDRTEHVLWRLREAPLTKLAPKVIVLMIGTNNLGHGSSNAEQTLIGIQRIVAVLREQCPAAVVHLLDIFPRGERFNALRGDIAQINQALTRLDDGRNVRFVRVGDRFVELDGSIRAAIMPDALHLSAEGYRLWAEALLPSLNSALGG